MASGVFRSMGTTTYRNRRSREAGENWTGLTGLKWIKKQEVAGSEIFPPNPVHPVNPVCPLRCVFPGCETESRRQVRSQTAACAEPAACRGSLGTRRFPDWLKRAKILDGRGVLCADWRSYD